MISSDTYILKDFLDQLSEEKKKELINFLDPEESEILNQIPVLHFHPSKGLSSLEIRLSQIHYSWFVSFLEHLQDPDKYLFIASLPLEHQEVLYHHFDLSRRSFSIHEFAQKFMRKLLYEYLVKDPYKLLPVECLPEDPLNSLLLLSRDQLLHMIDLLSLHDLSLELKTIINASHLTKILSLLSNLQRDYLSELKKKIEPIAFRPIGLNHWNGDEPLLKKILHQRGLNRLAKALCSSHLSLVWHLCHKLDIGRASIVQTLFKDLKNKKAHSILISQVSELVNTL